MFKSKFNIIYENIMKSLISESGNAIKGGSRIKKENIESTLNLIQTELFDKIGIKHEWWDILGSTGKKESSGDIDIGVELNKVFEKTEIKDKKSYGEKLDKICEENDWQHNNRLNTGADTYHIGIPIVGQPNEIVQLDLMSSYDLNFTKFKYFSPAENESKYKGALRGILIDVILKYTSMANADLNDTTPYEIISTDGNIKSYPGKTFSFISMGPNGFGKTTKTFKGTTKDFTIPKTISRQELTKNPQECLDILFGKNTFSETDFQSFETIWNNVLMSEKFPYKNLVSNIIKTFVENFKNWNKRQLDDHKVELPQEIIEWANKNNINIGK